LYAAINVGLIGLFGFDSLKWVFGSWTVEAQCVVASSYMPLPIAAESTDGLLAVASDGAWSARLWYARLSSVRGSCLLLAQKKSARGVAMAAQRPGQSPQYSQFTAKL
jgi:hypothetical protein